MVRIIRDVGGIRGLHIALDAFSEEAERRLFVSSSVHLPPEVNMQYRNSNAGGPTRNGTHTHPHDWHDAEIFRVCNVVRDSGLVPDYLPPDYVCASRALCCVPRARKLIIHASRAPLRARMSQCFAISYPAGCSGFKEHFDSRYKWGETVVGVTLGRAATLYFIPGNAAMKAKGPPGSYADPQEESGGNAARLDALRTRLKSCERAAPCTQHDATRCALITTPSPHLFTPSSPC